MQLPLDRNNSKQNRGNKLEACYRDKMNFTGRVRAKTRLPPIAL